MTVGIKNLAGFGLALLIRNFIEVVSYRSTTVSTETRRWVAHTLEELETCEGMFWDLAEAETEHAAISLYAPTSSSFWRAGGGPTAGTSWPPPEEEGKCRLSR
jgi:hypothetical protein